MSGEITLTIRATARTAVVDALGETLRELAAEGLIDDAEDSGWTYGTEPVVVVCVRDPDFSNDFTVFGAPAPTIVDLDLGYMDLGWPEEFIEWADAKLANAEALPAGPARDFIVDVVNTQLERHHNDFDDLEALRVHVLGTLQRHEQRSQEGT